MNKMPEPKTGFAHKRIHTYRLCGGSGWCENYDARQAPFRTSYQKKLSSISTERERQKITRRALFKAIAISSY